jgi:hypothetical protein
MPKPGVSVGEWVVCGVWVCVCVCVCQSTANCQVHRSTVCRHSSGRSPPKCGKWEPKKIADSPGCKHSVSTPTPKRSPGIRRTKLIGRGCSPS